MTVTINPDAANRYWRSIAHGGQWVPSYAQRMYHETLKFIQGMTLDHVVGSDGMVYAVLPPDVRCFHYTPQHSKVIAVVGYSSTSTGAPVTPPIEPREYIGAGAWWKNPPYDLDVLRVLTDWTDGFMAFVPHQESPTNEVSS